jgi:hypothetical protein
MRDTFAVRIPLLVGQPRLEALTGTLHLLSPRRQACHLSGCWHDTAWHLYPLWPHSIVFTSGHYGGVLPCGPISRLTSLPPPALSRC